MLLWALLWFLLLLGAGLALGLLARLLWGKAKALTQEIGEASERLTAVLATLNDVADPAGDPPPRSAEPRPGAGGRRRDQRAGPH